MLTVREKIQDLTNFHVVEVRIFLYGYCIVSSTRSLLVCTVLYCTYCTMLVEVPELDGETGHHTV